MEPKRWGPFSGAQLTMMLVTLIVVVALPIGAGAVLTFSNVAITDPGGVNQATVDSAHNLHTSVNGGTVGVTGSVTATKSPPSLTFHKYVAGLGTACITVATAPAGKALVVDEIHVSESALTTTGALVVTLAKGSCATKTTVDNPSFNKVGQNSSLSYPAGLPFATGVSLVALSNDAGAAYTVSVHGYLLPSSACTSGC
jgi:hypothetical protein